MKMTQIAYNFSTVPPNLRADPLRNIMNYDRGILGMKMKYDFTLNKIQINKYRATQFVDIHTVSNN
jgi:hypothetical protein